MANYIISDIDDGELPRSLSGLGNTSGLGGLGASPAPLSSATLKRGSRGALVTELQLKLNDFGYGLSTDGVFGAGTEAAVKKVQAKLGVPTDGIFGPATFAKLYAVNQSGVVDASASDKAAIMEAGKSEGLVKYGPPAPGGQTVNPDGSLVKVGDTLGPAAPSMFQQLQMKFDKFRSDPNFKYYMAAAGALLVGAVVYFGPKLMSSGGTKRAEPVQTLGLGRIKRKRKSRKSTKAKGA